MYKRKVYGQTGSDGCPFCGKNSTTVNEQKIPVCKDHKTSILGDMKCICGDYLDIKIGKYGLYFNCFKCGNVTKRKAFEINEVKDISEQKTVSKNSNSEKPNNQTRASQTNPATQNKSTDSIFDSMPKTSSSGSSDKFSKKSLGDEFILGDEVVRSDDPRYFD